MTVTAQPLMSCGLTWSASNATTEPRIADAAGSRMARTTTSPPSREKEASSTAGSACRV
jgi:hypothetical protein